MRFYDDIHKDRYNQLLERMGCTDEYHSSVAYLFALDDDCYKHINDLYDFEDGGIKPQTAFSHGWQTGTSCKTTRLAYNLWNGWADDWHDDDTTSVSRLYAVDNIFCCCLAPYYIEALKLRFSQYFE